MIEGYWSVPREWEGETAVIIGGGPSIEAGDIHTIEAQQLPSNKRSRWRVIVINDSFKLYPQAEVLYFRDESWWVQNKASVYDVWGGQHIVTLENQLLGVKRLRETDALGLEQNPSGLRHGNNSGYAAINLAYHFGVERIILLGYDMKVSNAGRTHWHTRDVGRDVNDFANTLKYDMLPNFQFLRLPLAKARVVVINATPGSALDIWPYRSLEELL